MHFLIVISCQGGINGTLWVTPFWFLSPSFGVYNYIATFFATPHPRIVAFHQNMKVFSLKTFPPYDVERK